MRPEPYIEESAYQRKLEREHKLYLRGCPWCNVCDEQIEDARCYVLDPNDEMGSCICKDCMEKQLRMMRATKINAWLMEAITEEMEYNWEHVTPHDARLEEVEYAF